MACLTAFAVASPATLPPRAARSGRCGARPVGAPRWGAAPRLRLAAADSAGGVRWWAAADGNGEAPAAADKAVATEVRGGQHGRGWGGCLPCGSSLCAPALCATVHLACALLLFSPSLPLARGVLCDDGRWRCTVPIMWLFALHAHSLWPFFPSASRRPPFRFHWAPRWTVYEHPRFAHQRPPPLPLCRSPSSVSLPFRVCWYPRCRSV